jgi:hypothetical protein
MLTREVCRHFGEAFGLWAVVRARAQGEPLKADADYSSIKETEVYAAFCRELEKQEGEFFEASPLYGELSRGMAAVVRAETAGLTEDRRHRLIAFALQFLGGVLDERLASEVARQLSTSTEPVTPFDLPCVVPSG